MCRAQTVDRACAVLKPHLFGHENAACLVPALPVFGTIEVPVVVKVYRWMLSCLHRIKTQETDQRMSERFQFLKNTGYALLGQLFQQALMIIYFVIVSRYLNKAELGVYSYAVSTAGLFLAVVDLGISTLIVREIARDRSTIKTLMPQVVGLKTTAGLIMTAILWGVSFIAVPTPEAGSALRLMSLILLLSPLLTSYVVIFQATERLELRAITQFMNRAAMLAALGVVIFLGYRIKGVIATQLFGVFSIMPVAFYLTKKYYSSVGIGFDIKVWKSILKRAVPFMAMSVIWEIYNRIDQIIIPYLDSMEGNGLYAVAFKYSFVFIGIPTAVNSVVYPYFSRRSMVSDAPVISAMAELYKYMGIIGLAITVFTAVPAREWIVLFSGVEYAEAAPTLVVLACCIPFIFYNSVNISALYSYNRQYSVLLYSIITIITNLVLDMILIPRIGNIGAACASLISIIVMSTATLLACKRIFDIKPLLLNNIGPLIAAVCMFATLIFAADYNLLIRIPAASAVFAGALVISGTITKKDFVQFSDMLHGN